MGWGRSSPSRCFSEASRPPGGASSRRTSPALQDARRARGVARFAGARGDPTCSGASRHATFNGGSQAEEAFRRLRTNFLLQVREDVQTVLVNERRSGRGQDDDRREPGPEPGAVRTLGRPRRRGSPRPHGSTSSSASRSSAPGLGDVLSASPDARTPSEGRSSNGKAAEAGLLRRITHALLEGGEMRRADIAATVGHASNGGTFTRALKLGVALGVLMTTGRGTYELVDHASPGSVAIDELGVPAFRASRGWLCSLPGARSTIPPRSSVRGPRSDCSRICGARSTSCSSTHRPSAPCRRPRDPLQRRRRPAGRRGGRAARRASPDPRRARTRRGAAHGHRPQQRERPRPLPVRRIPVTPSATATCHIADDEAGLPETPALRLTPRR